MADENQNQTPPQDPPQPNTPEARTPDGTLKDQTSTPPSGTETPEAKPKDQSFLNRKPEAAPAAEKPEGDKEPPKEGEKPEVAAGAPEKYEPFKLPDGYEFDPEALKEVSGLFKDAGLSQDAAQKLVDYYAKNGLQAAEAPYKLWADTQKAWVDEIGNRFGSRAEGMRTDINKAIDVAMPPKLRSAFREALDLTGAGSNPDFFEALSLFAKPFLEGTPVTGGKGSPEANKPPAAPAKPSIAEAMYPHLVKGGQ